MWARSLVILASGVVLLAAACAPSGDQYVENDEGTVFAKVPDEWSLLDLGVVNPSLVPEGGKYEGLPGDVSLPWRVAFAEDLSDENPQVVGVLEVQPIDRRWRDDPRSVLVLLGFNPDDTADGIEVWNTGTIEVGDLDGFVLTYRTGDPDLLTRAVVATDDRRSAAYVIRAGCQRDCFYANEELIEDIVRSLHVEDPS